MQSDLPIERVPPDESTALYANTYDVWTSPHDIAIDLFAVGPPEPEGARAVESVARVRLPSTMVVGMLQRLSAALDDFDDRASA